MFIHQYNIIIIELLISQSTTTKALIILYNF